MSLALLQNVTATGFGTTTYFGASGGTAPYTFSILTAGAGGSINPNSGLYTAPIGFLSTATNSIDVIQVTDSLAATSSAAIMVGGALELFCDIIQNQLSLPNDHVYLWDQKINQPIDSALYVAVSVPSCKPFGNNIQYITGETGPTSSLFSYRTYAFPAVPGSTPFQTYDAYNTSWFWLSYSQEADAPLLSVQSVNMQATVDVDIISRSTAARDQKELVLMALQSVYSEQQQEANSFSISRLPISGRFINLSNVDGAAIPYRYRISFSLQYSVSQTTQVQYYNQFATPTFVVNA